MSGRAVKSQQVALSLILFAVVLLSACTRSAPGSQIIGSPAVAPQPIAASGRTPTTQTLEGKVVGVADGDTMTVLGAGNRQTRVRLQGIDARISAPEHGAVLQKLFQSGEGHERPILK